MATPPSDDTRSLFKLLADGQWHPYEQIRDELAATVPPGRALRKYQERVEYARKYKRDPTYDTSASEDDRIYFGARACAQIAITSWKNRGLEVTGTAENKQIRIKPGFKTWGIGTNMNGDEDEVEPEDERNSPGGGQERADEPERAEESPPSQQWRERQADGLVERGFPQHEAREAAGLPQVEIVPDAMPGRSAGAASDPGDPGEPDQGDEYSWGVESEEKIRERRYTISETSQPVTTTECQMCGAEVLDVSKHAEWHEQFIARSAPEQREDMALFAESEIRSLLRDVVETVLDQFQENMVQYLSTQFAHVDAGIHLLSVRLGRQEAARAVDQRRTIGG